MKRLGETFRANGYNQIDSVDHKPTTPGELRGVS
ncbi:MAG: hypothetical protein QOH55_987 [Microbacteriaceae bacterium]|nr:hypothetical protein [Microbacteriaceae bacterium]